MLPVLLGVGDAAGPRAGTAPRTSLVQAGSKSKKVSLVAGGESMLTAGSMSHALAGFQKFTDDLVDQYKKTGLPMDQQTKDAINIVIEYINGMNQRLLDWHEIDVNRAKSCGTGKYNRCVDDHLGAAVQAVITWGASVDDSRLEVRSCAEKAHNDTIQTSADCAEYDRYRILSEAELPRCVKPTPGELGDDFINTMDTTVNGKRDTMEDCLQDMKDWFQPLYDRYLKCPSPRDDDAHKFVCSTEQNEFEKDHCDWSEKKVVSCDAYKICVNEADEDCGGIDGNGGICGEIKINVDARKAENETGERIICLLDVLVNSSNASKPGDLEACKNTTYNTSVFNLECPVVDGSLTPIPAEFQECNITAFEAWPCTNTFLMTEYRKEGGAPAFMDDQIRLCDCKACEMITPIVPAPDCTVEFGPPGEKEEEEKKTKKLLKKILKKVSKKLPGTM